MSDPLADGQSTYSPTPNSSRLVRSLAVAAIIFVVLVVSVAIAAAGARNNPQQTAPAVAVTIANFAYQPEEIWVAPGTLVEWTNRDAAPHDVVSEDRVTISSSLLNTGERFSQRFDRPGVFDYFCTLHPSMRGSVVVGNQPPGGGTVFLPLLATGTSTTPTPPTPLPNPTIPTGERWSDPAAWPGGRLPVAGAYVVVPAGHTLILDMSPPPLRALQLDGTLVFADRDLNLTANWIMVHGGGALRIGSPSQAHTHKATITLAGNSPDENVMGMGTKFLGAMMGGTIAIYGEERVNWTRLAVTAQAGASQLTLTQPVDWRVGERIVIASSSMNPDEAEVRTITAVNAATVTLDRPLDYRHWGELQQIAGRTLDERAEVGLLSRNIVIQGDSTSTASNFGGHVMIMGASAAVRETNPALRSSAKVRGVEFRRMGQFDRLGRYPFHWHQNGSSPGDFLAGSAVSDSLQRGIVVHGTDGVLVKDNVVYNTVGHAYVIEDGSERTNSFQGNLGLLARPAEFTVTGLKDQNDKAAATYWLRTAAATLTGNVAAGGRFAGFWFDLGFVDGANATKGQLTFRDNVAHSHGGERVPGTERDSWAIWHTDGFVASEEGVLRLERVTAYKNVRGIETLGRGVVSDSVLADNGMAFTGILLHDSLVVSRSANDDRNENWGSTGMFAYGGFANAENVTWVNFTNGRTIARTLACGIEYPRFTLRRSTLINSDLAAGCGDVIVADLDGSLSGNQSPRALVYVDSRTGRNEFGLVTNECERRSAAGLAICPGYDYRTLSVTYPLGPTERFANDDWRVDVVRDEDGDRVRPEHFRWAAYVIPGRLYRLELRSARNQADTTNYPLTTLSRVTLGLSRGEFANPELLPGGRSVVYDPAWAERTVTVYMNLPAQAFQVRRCARGEQCGDDQHTWPIVGPAASRAALEATSGAGYAIDQAAGKIYFQLRGGDQLRIERN